MTAIPEGRDQLEREIEVLEERAATLRAVVLRLSDRLDLATVVPEAVDSVRVFTRLR